MAKLRALIVVSVIAVPLQLSAQANDSTGSGEKHNLNMKGGKNPHESSGAKAPGNENAEQTTPAQKQLEEETLAKLHLINQHEMQAGQLAQQRGQSPEVRNYGQTLNNDHQQLDGYVISFVERNNIPLQREENGAGAASPKTQAELKKMRQEQQAHAQHLQSTSDAQFDREFVRTMVKGHQQAIQLVRTAQNQAKDTEFKSFLADTLPVLKKHLEIAQGLQHPADQTSKTSDTPSKNQ